MTTVAASTHALPPPDEMCRRMPRLAPLIRYLESLNGRADLGRLSALLASATLVREDVAERVVFGGRGYRRNTVSRSDWYELLVLCWRSGDVTPIHDHEGSSCAFRVVEGTGTEVRFRVTDSGLICPVSSTQMEPGYICAAEDADIHQVANMQAPGRDLITVHIYSPPISQMRTYSPLGVKKVVCLENDPDGHEGCL